MESNNTERNRKNNTRPLYGIILIGVGLLWMAKNLNLIPHDLSRLIFHWPMLLITVGLVHLISERKKINGWGLIIVGTAFLTPDVLHFFGIQIDFDLRKIIWPVALIIFGSIVFFSEKKYTIKLPKRPEIKGDSDDYLDEINFFGGGNRIITSKKFKGGKITNLFGGSEIDFTRAVPSEEGCLIDFYSMFGGSKILVPSDWNVTLEVFSIFGGFSDKRASISTDTDHAKKLIIKGFCMFGGGELKSF